MKLKRNIIIFSIIAATTVGCGSNGILSNNKNSNNSNYSYISDSNDSYVDISDYISSNSDIDSSSDEINEYVTVTYDANGGVFSDSTSIKEDRVKKGSKLITPEIPTRVGYTFVSWYYDDIPVESGKWIVPCDCIITAEWKYEKYNITYELNGGSVNNNPSTYNYEDETITLNNPTKVGYTFIGWTGENYDTPTLEVTIPSHSINNRTYVANWKANEYKVTFDVNGGNELETTEYTYTYDSEYTLPTPTRDGYIFIGWYYNDTLVTSGKWSITSDCTLTAHYSVNQYEVVLKNTNTNAGTISGAGSYDYGSTVTIKATANDGYTFAGWYDLDNNCISTNSEYTFTMELSNVLTAKWSCVDLTINYIVDGKTVYTSTYTLDNQVTKLYQYETDKCFYGWYKTNTFNSDDEKVTSTEELTIENNNVYLYGTVLDAN